MQVVTEPVEYLADWAAQRIPGCTEFTNPAAVGICRDDQLTAVAVFSVLEMWDGGGHAEISFAADSPRWATKQAVNFILGVGFHTLGCSRLTARIEKRLRRSRKLVEGLGFVREGALRQATPEGRTVILYGLLRKEFEEGKYG